MPKHLNTLLKYGLLITGLLVVLTGLAYSFFISNFQMFEVPEKQIIGTKCDFEGLRSVSIYTLVGNAVTNPSIHVSTTLGCNSYPKDTNEEILIFTADRHAITGQELDIKWTSIDTLIVTYDSNLRIFTKENSINFGDSTLDISILYNEKN